VDPNAPVTDRDGAVCRYDALLNELGLCTSRSDAQRQIKAGAVSLATGDLGNPVWEKVTDPAGEFKPSQFPCSNSIEVAFRVGRKQARVRFTLPLK
jgi:predicted rRNA methylase YqxC with S4 and FtsJ domains